MLIGLDIGTSGARALAVSESGDVIAAAAQDYPLLTPRPGWTEQNPEDWWQASRKVLAEVAKAVNGKVAGIGLTGQMHGAVFLDANDRVIRPALLWNDQRTAAQCAEITERVGRERLLAIAGNPALTGFQAPKLLWLREVEPEHYRRIAHVLLPKDFIRLRLAGEYATDASDASGTLLLDLRRRSWSAEILDALELPREWLPAVYEGPEEAGRLRADVAADLGLPAGVPIAAGGGDNAAAAVGCGIVEEGLASSSIGTSGVLFAYTPQFTPDPSGRLHAFCHAVPGAYHLMGVTLSAGGSLNWWRQVLGEQHEYDALIELAEGAPVGSEGLLFLPYLSGERTPHLDPSARGAFFGLTARHRLNHLTRAVMEGVTYSLADCLQLMLDLGVEVNQVRAIGGGARSRLWRQMQADVFGMPVHRTTVDEGPAYGAALLAGVTAGHFKSVNEACSVIQLRPDVAEPNKDNAELYSRYLKVYRDLYPATAAAMAQLSDLGSAADR
ncbi:MAG TPA: xylulokinase [Candidatus Eisenbacteria bacterium]|nr:xylulokinase [Candidatus Eisenbacteria bacterium]